MIVCVRCDIRVEGDSAFTAHIVGQSRHYPVVELIGCEPVRQPPSSYVGIDL